MKKCSVEHLQNYINQYEINTLIKKNTNQSITESIINMHERMHASMYA